MIPALGLACALIATATAPDAGAAGFFETLIRAIADPPSSPAPRATHVTHRPATPLPLRALAKATPRFATPRPALAKATPPPATLRPTLVKVTPPPLRVTPRPELATATSPSATASDPPVAAIAPLTERQRRDAAVALARRTWALRTDGQQLSGMAVRKVDATEYVVTATGHEYGSGGTSFRMIVRDWYGMSFVRSDDAVSIAPRASPSPAPLAAQEAAEPPERR